jgi:glycerol uptake facilitator-like aquaporin
MSKVLPFILGATVGAIAAAVIVNQRNKNRLPSIDQQKQALVQAIFQKYPNSDASPQILMQQDVATLNAILSGQYT